MVQSLMSKLMITLNALKRSLMGRSALAVKCACVIEKPSPYYAKKVKLERFDTLTCINLMEPIMWKGSTHRYKELQPSFVDGSKMVPRWHSWDNWYLECWVVGQVHIWPICISLTQIDFKKSKLHQVALFCFYLRPPYLIHIELYYILSTG